MKPCDLVGLRFGKLTVVSRLPNNKFNKQVWLCQCDCGNTKPVVAGSLRSGVTKSCGCNVAPASRAAHLKHGKCRTTAYTIWANMKDRCRNPKNPGYKNYGGRGIKVCDRWANSFEAFLTDMGDRPAGMSLDRRNNDGSYEPGNCRWATRKQQSDNSRRPVRLTFAGRTMNLSEWADYLGINARSLSERLKTWPLAEALSRGKSHKWSRRPRITRG